MSSAADQQTAGRGGAVPLAMGEPERAAAVWPGSPSPLGAAFRTGPGGEQGTNFALWAAGAEAVELCLFDDADDADHTGGADGAEGPGSNGSVPDGSPVPGGSGGGRERRLPLTDRTDGIWHGFVPGVRPGQRYGYRVHGPWDPWTGARWNPAKLLLDPYARAVDGDWAAAGLAPELYGHVRDWPDQRAADTVRDERDSAPYVPKGVVVHDEAPGDVWLDDRRPKTPWRDSVIYELHVRGFTMRHPGIPPRLRGTYAGLGHPAATEYLRGLGVTAVELLPVHAFAHEDHLLRRGLRNYWGYNSIGYFAPHPGYARAPGAGREVREFKEMVRALHAAGIEVILDVVYNHTAESGELGPTLSLKGIDNPGYYRLAPDARHYTDYTGCGNTLDVTRPQVIRLITDSLRYWVTEMGVDGFRFDLAATLARSHPDVDMLSPFLAVIAQDPVLRRVKLIAEPWDVGAGGYQTGAFPPLWAEWNDRFRDAVRDFWRGALPDMRDLGYRLTGSSDLFEANGRGPYASVNFVTAHDGFTLRDLVSYERKHNEGNGEGNRDGSDDNRSWNCGAEGGSDDPEVTALRRRQSRNMLATLLLATGVPMLVAGDEFGRTQGGNNNAYCQDNEVGWVDWDLLADPLWRPLHTFTARLVALRRRHPVLRRRAFFTGERTADGLRDLAWFTAAGAEMTPDDWYAPAHCVGAYLSGRGITGRDARGRRIEDDSLFAVWHAGADPVAFLLPGAPWAGGYEPLVDTGYEDGVPPSGPPLPAGAPVQVAGRTVLVLRALDARGE
ncbi:glycogen debranching protein GlgX [Streptomyces sp. NPDC050560]|uniref:glycogen debranching protein GlgX n=1 Tax=Streptomyces sp. NPDC050560 TaxID=3365630 RepID=UPI0037A2B935